jgi:TPR repeat protein
MQEIFERSDAILNSVTEDVLDDVASTRRFIRERAIHTLTSTLDPEAKEDQEVYQALPLWIMNKGDIIWAIWYVETIWKLWNKIDWENVAQIIRTAIDEKIACDNFWDEEASRVIIQSLKSLFKMAVNHEWYSKIDELYILMWDIEEIYWNTWKAIEHYSKAVELGSVWWYIALADVYMKRGQWEQCVKILEDGFFLTKDLKILSRLITALYTIGRNDESLNRYEELKKLDKNKIPPYIVYIWTIENDDELLELEVIFAEYLGQGNFIPLESFHRLSISASEYVSEWAHRMNERIDKLDKRDFESWTDEEGDDFIQAIQKRLYYMQIDILTLGNHRYLDYYLRDINNFWLQWSPQRIAILEDYFSKYFSKDVEVHIKIKDAEEKAEEEKERKLSWDDEIEGDEPSSQDVDNESGTHQWIFQSISLHIARIGEVFFNPSFYDVQSEAISPILIQSAKLAHEYDDEMEDDITVAMGVLKENHDYYYTLRWDIRENYESYIAWFDTKYWTFFRKYIQSYAINNFDIWKELPEAFLEYPDVAFLFFIEKILWCNFPCDEGEDIDALVSKYWFNDIGIKDALLFGSLIWDVSIEYAIIYLANYPNMLDVPNAIYIITEWMRQLDVRTKNQVLRDLHNIAKESYWARGFFEHIWVVFNDIYKTIESDQEWAENGSYNEEVEYMLLSRWNMSILQKKDRAISILNFQSASEIWWVEWLLQAGDSNDDMWNNEKALSLFEEAFLQDDSIVVVCRILNCAIQSKDYPKAQFYIDYAIKKWYNVSNYIMAFYLWQWRTKQAFEIAILNMRNKIEFIDAPKWCLRLFKNTIEFSLATNWIMLTEELELSIQASFIQLNITFDDEEPNIIWMLIHWQYISSLFSWKTWDELHSIVENTLRQFTWEIYDTFSKNERTIRYINQHAKNCHDFMIVLLKRAQENKDIPLIEGSMKVIAIFCEYVATLLLRFPDSEWLAHKWRKSIVLLTNHEIWKENLQEMPNIVQ